MKVTGKLMAPFVALALALVAVLGMGLWVNRQIAAINAKADLASRQMILASEVRALSRAIQRDAINTIFDEDKARDGLLKSIGKRAKLMIDTAKKLNGLFEGDDIAAMKGFLHTNEVVVQEINATTTLAIKGDKDGAYNHFRQKVRVAEKVASKLVDKFIDDNEKRISVFESEVASTDQMSNILLLSFGLLMLAGTMGAGILVILRAVTRPLNRLVNDVQTMSQGDYSHEIAGVARKDELGSLAKALDVFRGELAKMAQMREEQVASARERERAAAEQLAERESAQRQRDEDRARAEAEQEKIRETAKNARIAAEEQKAKAAAEQAAVLQTIAEGLGQLSDGNLTYRIDDQFPDSYSKLKDDFNAAMVKLADTIALIQTSTTGIHAGSSEISHAADDLSARTERQAASLEETTAALREIMETVRKTTERTHQASDVVTGAQTDASESAKVMQTAVSAMNEIQESVKKITQIIGLIDEIAFQTNLLALNAGVEAARAGEVGRGFAVVASEVRSLAQRSADAAKDIKSLITVSTKQVDGGVSTIGKAGETLNRIVARVDEIRGVVLEIASAAKQQESGLHEVTTAVGEMDEVTQQNAAMVEQTTAASHSLAKEATQLAALMSRFQIRDAAASDVENAAAA